MPVVHKKPLAIEPMYASIGHDVPTGRDWTFEPKFDGVRVLAHVTARGVSLLTRNGNDKAKQYPEVVSALAGAAWSTVMSVAIAVRTSVARVVGIRAARVRGRGDCMENRPEGIEC